MPGYKPLPSTYSGSAAEQVRIAEVVHRAGDAETAVVLLEELLEAFAARGAELPGWICGRLAALYRALKRYDDEVLVLERFRSSQSTEDARTRFDARLSKARAIAERKRRRDTRALWSVRQVMSSRHAASRGDSHGGTSFSPACEAELRSLLEDLARADRGDDEEIAAAVERAALDADRLTMTAEDVARSLREIWCAAPRPSGVDPTSWGDAYRLLLLRTLDSFLALTAR